MKYTKLLTLVLLVAVACPWAFADEDDADAAARADAPRRGQGRAVVLSEQQEAELLEWTRENRPEDFARLTKLKEEDASVYRWATTRAWGSYQRFKGLPPELQQELQAQHQARIRAWKLSREYRDETDATRREEIRAQLLEALGEDFDIQRRLRKHRLEQMTRELQRLKDEMDDQAERRDEIIEENLDKLLEMDRPRGMSGGGRGHRSPRGDSQRRRTPPQGSLDD